MVLIKCKHCGYEWDSNSKLIWVSCPSCMGKTETGVLKEILEGKKEE